MTNELNIDQVDPQKVILNLIQSKLKKIKEDKCDFENLKEVIADIRTNANVHRGYGDCSDTIILETYTKHLYFDVQEFLRLVGYEIEYLNKERSFQDGEGYRLTYKHRTGLKPKVIEKVVNHGQRGYDDTDLVIAGGVGFLLGLS